MESLNTLASSLPNANNLANSEKELLNNFKAAALSITTLYRSSRQTSKRAYNAGYGAACQDLLLMIQQGVSVGGASDPSSSGSVTTSDNGGNEMTIGKVMDWIEARLEAIKSREEEEEEDEEKERTKNNVNTSCTTTTTTTRPSVAKEAPAEVSTKGKTQQSHSMTLPLTPHSPTNVHTYVPRPSSPPSPSPPSTPSLTHRATHQLPKPSKSRVAFPALQQADNYKFSNGAATGTANSEDTFGVGVGAKRRHAVMMMLDSAAPSPVDLPIGVGPSSGSADPSMHNVGNGISHGGGRRRTRSTRVQGHGNQQTSEAMDVEEDGRERKRVSRR